MMLPDLGLLLLVATQSGFGGVDEAPAPEESACEVQNEAGQWVSCEALLVEDGADGDEFEEPAAVAAPPPRPKAPEAAEAPAPLDLRRFRRAREVDGPFGDAVERVREAPADSVLLGARVLAAELELDVKQARADARSGLLDEARLAEVEAEYARAARVRELLEVLALRRRETCLGRAGKIDLVKAVMLPLRVDVTLAHPRARGQMAIPDPPECRRETLVGESEFAAMTRVEELERRLREQFDYQQSDEKKALEAELATLSEEVRGASGRARMGFETKVLGSTPVPRWGPSEVRRISPRPPKQADPDSD